MLFLSVFNFKIRLKIFILDRFINLNSHKLVDYFYIKEIDSINLIPFIKLQEYNIYRLIKKFMVFILIILIIFDY